MTDDDRGIAAYKLYGRLWVHSPQILCEGLNNNAVIQNYMGNKQPSCANECKLCPL